MVLTGAGTGGLEELRDTLDESRASFAYVRVQYSNDKESMREKFAIVVWIGGKVKVMRKAKVRSPPVLKAKMLAHCCLIPQVSVHTGDVKHVLRNFSIEVSASNKDDLKEDDIVTRLRKVRKAPPAIYRVMSYPHPPD